MEAQRLQRRRQTRNCPVCFDLIEDKVVNRMVYVFLSFVMFLIIAQTLLSTTSRNAPNPSSISLGIPLPYQLNFIEPLSDSRTPRIFVKNKFGGIQGRISINFVVSPEVDFRPKCNTFRLNTLVYTVEQIRFGQICRPVLTSPTAISDVDGVIKFTNFAVERGPVGTYVISYETENGVTSDLEEMAVNSKVVTAVVQNAPPVGINIGDAFTTQPRILLKDGDGNPVVGHRVVAFSWVDSHFQSDRYDQVIVNGFKLSILDGEVSEPSDSTGVATFTNLKVIGSTTAFVHLFFSIDGKIVLPWLFQPLNPPAPSVPIPPQARFPIFLGSTVTQIQIVTAPPTTVAEGEAWTTQPKIRVKDSSGNPVAGQIVFANGYPFSSGFAPLGFRNKNNNVANKKLLYAVKGTYAQADVWLNGQQESFVPAVTDANGEITFDQLMWDTQGIAGSSEQFALFFICNGVVSSPHIMTVQSKVANIELTKAISNPQTISSTSEFDFIINLRVTDSNGNGVEGKYVKGVTLNVQAPHAADDIVFGVVDTASEFSNSDDNGFMSMPIKILVVKQTSVNVQVIFQVDDATVNIGTYTFNGNQATVPSHCSYISTTTDPPSTTSNGSKFTPVYKAMKQDGSAWTGTVTAGVQFTPEYPYKVKPSIFGSYVTGISSTTADAATGTATFTDFEFRQQPSGTYLFRAQAQNADVANCFSDNFQMTVSDSIAQIVLQSPKNTDIFTTDQSVTTGTAVTSVIRILDSNQNPVTSTNVNVELKIAHMPPILFSQYFQVQDAQNFFTPYNQDLTSDANGDVSFTWTLKSGLIGVWVIFFQIGGIFTEPYGFKTEFDSSMTITIATQPVGNPLAVGAYLTTPPVIEVKDSSANPLQDYMVSTTLVPVDGSGNKDTSATRKEGIIDIYTSTFEDVEVHDTAGTLAQISTTFVTLTGEKNKLTDAAGQVTLDKLTILDVEGSSSACYRFYFYVGTHESGMFKVSAASDVVCYENTIEISIKNSPSTKISPAQSFAVSPIVRFTKPTQTSSDSAGLFMLTAVVSQINRVALTQKYFTFQQYLDSNVCIFFAGTELTGNCGNINVISTTPTYIGQVTFSGLQYTRQDEVDLYLRYSTPLQGDFNYVVSSKIAVKVIPEVLEFVDQPPATVKSRDTFQVKVAASLSNGSPLSFVQLFINITASQTVSSYTDNIFNMAANLATGINRLNDLSSSTNIRIGQQGAFAVTNAQGVATFSVQIVSGASGEYTLVAGSSNGVQSSPSNVITFANDVASVTQTNEITQTQSIVKKTSGNRDIYEVTLNPSPILTVLDTSNAKDVNQASNIQVYVFQESELKSAYQSLELTFNTSPSPGINTILENIGTQDSLVSDALKPITNGWSVLSRGASFIGALSKKSVDSFATYTVPTVNSDNNYIFSDLKITVPLPEKYYLIYYVDGIESQLSQAITVNDRQVDEQNSAVAIVITIIVYIVLFGLIYCGVSANAFYYRKCCNIVFIIIAIAVLIGLFFLFASQNYSYTLKILLYVGNSLLIASLVAEILQLCIPKWRKYVFYTEWPRVSHQYTYQKLFGRPSKNWQPKSLESNNRSTQKSPQKKQEHSIEFDQGNSASPISINPSNMKNDEKNPNGYGKTKFFRNGVIRNFIELFVPFQLRGQRSNVGDCFFYPQRFLIGFLISVFAFVFLAVNFYQFIINTSDAVTNLKRNVIQVIFSFIRSGVRTVYTWLKIDSTNNNIVPFTNAGNTIQEFFDDLARAILIGGALATTLASLLMVASLATLMYDFKRRVLLARQGVWPYPKRRFSIVNSTTFVGSIISTFIVGYGAIVAILAVALIIISHPVFWKVLWAYRWSLLTLLLPAIVNAILKVIAKKCLTSKYLIRFRRCFAVFDLFLLYTGIAASIVAGILRFVMMLVVGLVSLSKIDTPIAPMWVMNRIIWIDFPNGSYNALIHEHNSHRNPIVTTAVYALLSGIKNKSTGDQQIVSFDQKISVTPEMRKAAKRFQLAMLLAMNPSLIKYRKHNLPPPKKKNKKNKKKKNGVIPSPPGEIQMNPLCKISLIVVKEEQDSKEFKSENRLKEPIFEEEQLK